MQQMLMNVVQVNILFNYYLLNKKFTDDAHKAVGILTIKNGKRIIGMNKYSFLIMIIIFR
jgi:hypothetical protein